MGGVAILARAAGGVPLFFQLDDFVSALGEARELEVAAHVVLGDSAVDHIINRQAGEGEDAIEARADDSMFDWRGAGEGSVAVMRRKGIEVGSRHGGDYSAVVGMLEGGSGFS